MAFSIIVAILLTIHLIIQFGYPMASVSCKNCGSILAGAYCHSCGQTARTDRFTFQNILHLILHSLFHFDHGIWYTLLQLTIYPGRVIIEYWSGKRNTYFNPVNYILISGSLYSLLFNFVYLPLMPADTISAIGGQLLLLKYVAFINLILLPIPSLVTFLFYFRNGYNYWEHYIMNLFFAGHFLFIYIIIFPLFILLPFSNPLEIFLYTFEVLSIVYEVYALFSIFSIKPAVWRLCKALLVSLILEVVSTQLVIVVNRVLIH